MFFTCNTHTFVDGDKIEYGAKGVVVGPGNRKDKKPALKMKFPGSKNKTILLTELSRTKPVRRARVAACETPPCRW